MSECSGHTWNLNILLENRKNCVFGGKMYKLISCTHGHPLTKWFSNHKKRNLAYTL